MEPLRGLMLIPALLAMAAADFVARCLRRETLDERLERTHPGMHVHVMTDDMLPKVKP